MAETANRVMVPGYRHVPGNHCGSTALRNLLGFHGVEISEEMAFGLGAGACFYYVVLDENSPSRFTNGRAARLEENFLELTGAPLRLRTDADPDASWAIAKEAVDEGRPVLLLTDLYYLDHYGRSAHFPGHAVVLAGYDEELAWLSDTAFEDLQTTSLESLGEARHSQQPLFPLEGHAIDVPVGIEIDRDDLLARTPAAIERAASQMLPAAGRLRGAARAAAFQAGGRQLARGRGGLAVVRTLPLPGDRAPRDGRRQLPQHVLALPARGGVRGVGPRRRRRRTLDQARSGCSYRQRGG